MALHQFNLSNQDTEPWKDVCCFQCYTAQEEKCVCRCGGAHHGKGTKNCDAADEDMKQYPPLAEAQKYSEYITDSKCSCGYDLTGEPIHAYSHSGGWHVKGHGVMWLWITCPKCGYQHALWKLGVSRNQTIEDKVNVKN